MSGHQFTDEDIDNILTSVTSKDLSAAHAISKLINSFWDRTSEMHRRLTGEMPGKVGGVKVETLAGTYEGGYFPLRASKEAKLSLDQAIESDTAIQDMFGTNATTAMTAHHHTKSRIGMMNRRLDLSLDSTVGGHIAMVVHDLHYREPVIAINNLIKDPAFRASAESVIGASGYKQFHPWLVQVAGAGRLSGTAADRIAERIMNGATYMALAASYTTGISQLTGFHYSVNAIGLRATLRGMASVLGAGVNKDNQGRWRPGALNFAYEKSPEMRRRISNGWSFETQELMRRHGIDVASDSSPIIKLPGWTKDRQDAFIQTIGVAQMMVDLPTWHGAYEKALSGKVEGIAAGDDQAAVDYADMVVRTTQSGGGLKDRAAVQRSGGIQAVFNRFLTFHSAMQNQMAVELFKLKREDVDAGTVSRVIGAMMLMTAPVLYEDWLKGNGPLLPPDDEEEKEKFLKDKAAKIAMFPFAGFLGVRDILTAAEMASRKSTYTPTPTLVGFLGAAGQTLYTGIEAATSYANEGDYELKSRDMRSILKTFGTVTKTPMLQVSKTADILTKWADGEIEFDNALQFAKALATGKKPTEE
jgi:hypothetical protein